jgi:hypothetical protein
MRKSHTDFFNADSSHSPAVVQLAKKYTDLGHHRLRNSVQNVPYVNPNLTQWNRVHTITFCLSKVISSFRCVVPSKNRNKFQAFVVFFLFGCVNFVVCYS